ncbi:MAG: Gfo/Idh/MocA family oxidoreductase [Candidatus Omnitrophica bacterium]|nr:Gfo/Idh/MocA family oxidoreductase [Candidatus Omnitrophota bacterium]
MTEKVKLGIWGAGVWASLSARSILDTGNFEIAVCHDSNEENRRVFANEIECIEASSEEELLEHPGLHAVAIYTPNFLHADHAIRSFERGLHVFVEKPMANTVEESHRMLDAAKQAGRVLFVGHNTRRESRFRHIKSLLENEGVGTPVVANMTFTSPAGLKKELAGWRYDKNLCPALALSQIGVHAIDVLHFLLGWTRETQAWIRRVGLETDVEDVCLGRMEHLGGMSSTLTTAYSVPRVRNIQILGTKGHVESDLENEVLFQPLGSDREERIRLDPVDTIREEYREFAACCRGEREPETGGEAGFMAVAVMEAMIRSSLESKTVPVPRIE